MRQFSSIKNKTWEVDDYHKWSEREFRMKIKSVPLFDKSTPVVAIGSCFAEEVVKYLKTKDYNVAHHPNGLQYNTFTIRDHLQHLFGNESPYEGIEPLEYDTGEWRHPYKKVPKSTTIQKAKELSEELDEKAKFIWKNAELICITLGLTEIWEEVATKRVQIEIPHPRIYKGGGFAFRQTFYQENFNNLEEIYKIIRSFSNAPIVVTVSPIPLYATFSSQDITIANCLSKSTLRAAVGQFEKLHEDVYYFPSYEMVMYSMDPSVFMKADGRHVSPHGVSEIMEYFLHTFANPDTEDSIANSKEHKVRFSGIDSAELKKKSKKSIGSVINKLLRPLGIAIKRV